MTTSMEIYFEFVDEVCSPAPNQQVAFLLARAYAAMKVAEWCNEPHVVQVQRDSANQLLREVTNLTRRLDDYAIA